MPDLSSNSFLKSNNDKLFNMNKFKLKSFGGKKDFDFDGVPNWKDCLSRNTMRQHRYTNITKKKDYTIYKNPEGKKIFYWKKDPEAKGTYPSIDDVAYILDEVPAVYHGPRTHVNVISRKQYEQAVENKETGSGKVSDYTLGTFKAWGRGKDKPIINIYPQHKDYKGKRYQVTREALIHEIGHDIEKRKPELEKVWKEEVYPQDSPTTYGMHAMGYSKYRRGQGMSPPEFYGEWDEDFAESFTTWHGVGGPIHKQDMPLTQQRKGLFEEHIPERAGPSAREEWEQKQRPDLLIREAAKKATEDKDKDGVIAAADRDDTNPMNPRGFHWRETPDKSVPRWWARFSNRKAKKEEEILPVTHKEPPWAKIRELKNKKEEEEIRYQIELNRMNRMFPVAGGVKDSELTSDGFKLNKITRKSLRDKEGDLNE